MIKENELRMLNYVKSELYKDILQINMIDLCGVIGIQGGGMLDMKHVEPIPLTEEWLEKLGFTLGGYNMLFWHHEKLKGLDFAGINWADAEYPEYQFLNYGIGTEIYQVHYVHQLQNLYFALTGDELKPINKLNK